MGMATIGPGERGGSRRLALTDFDIEGRNLFRKWAVEAGCTSVSYTHLTLPTTPYV